MRQSSYTIGASQKKLRLIAGDHFISLPIKARKGDVKTLLDANEVLLAGTLITKDGKAVTSTSTTTDVYGVVYQDVSFKGSMSPTANVDDATEVVPVFVHGVLFESEVKFNADAAIKIVEKSALKQIIFGE
ncbi:hypothetical protein JMF89_13755 [Clostridiaceae bacterium UIB06]|nr:hypothetical protein [Clostridiaceae bacterium UIB06]